MRSSDSGRNIKLTSYDDIFSTEESRASAGQEKIVEIPLISVSCTNVIFQARP